MADVTALTEIKLEVVSEYRHHHADLVLARYRDVEAQVRELVSGRHAVVQSTRQKQRVERAGLTATSLNMSLKQSFMRVGDWGFEATVADGVIYDADTMATSREGFDLAQYDHASNVARLWSVCFGRRPVNNGQAWWDHHLDRRPSWRAAVGRLVATAPGTDIHVEPASPTLFGDIQFGNWGLAYRDLMRLLDADAQVDVDLYVYITGADSLNAYLSEGIVTFAGFKAILMQFSNLIKVPIWVVGLGLDQ